MRSTRDLLSTVLTTLAALIVASGAAAFVLALFLGGLAIFPLALLATSAVAFSVGLPIYLGMRAQRQDTAVVAAVMGFIVGAIVPTVLVLSGPAADEASVGATPTVVHGSYTRAGWLENITLIALFGALGLAGGLLFWLIVRKKSQNGAVDRELSSLAPRKVGLLAAAAAIVVAALVIPWAIADRTCHNPLRSGGTSAAEVASFDLQVGPDQWPNVAAEVGSFGRTGDWSIRSDIRTDPSFRWLQLSLCKEPGPLVTVQGIPDFNEVHFGVYPLRSHLRWEKELRSLYDRIRSRWPSQISFTDEHGTPIAAPEWTRPRR